MSQEAFKMSERRLPVYKIDDFDITKNASNLAYFHDPPAGFYILSLDNRRIYVRCSNNAVGNEKIELNSLQRNYLKASFNNLVIITSWNPPVLKHVIFALKSKDNNPFVDENVFKQYLISSRLPMTVGLEYSYKSLTQKFIPMDANDNGGIVTEDTQVIIESNPIIAIAKSESKVKVDFNFSKLGIGGLKLELDTLFRRFFLMRMFSSSTLSRIGINPTKGLLMHGPPGCGKTLIARNIGQSLNCTISIINGPEILNKFVGQSEENLRKPFEAAKKDPNNLHLVIFDEIDSICRKRGSSTSSVGDGVVNQLLTLMDGVEQNYNILVIGLTNRLDMIDEALLRPGRFEAKIYIPLPKYEDRIEIIRIHTQKLVDSNSLKELAIPRLAQETEDFSGADLAGLVRNTVSFAASRNCVDGKIISEQINVTEEDFYKALTDVKKQVHDYPQVDLSLINLPSKPIISILILGDINSGKTTLAQNIANRISSHRTVKIIDNMTISRRDKDNSLIDSYNSIKYCSSGALILDNLEILIEYNPLTSFNNLAYQSILTILRDKPPSKSDDHPTIIIIVTSSDEEMIQRVNMKKHFDLVLKLGKDFSYSLY